MSTNASLSQLSAIVFKKMMEKHQARFAILLSIIVFFGLISLALCVLSEFKKSKKKDLRLDGKLCFLPGSTAFGFGIAALVSLFIAQVVGNLLVCKEFRSTKGHGNSSSSMAQKPFFPIILQILSWISFGTTSILLGAASSMNRDQAMREGWLDGECYIVKDGVYIGSAVLVVITLSLIISSSVIINRRRQSEQGKKVHAQAKL